MNVEDLFTALSFGELNNLALSLDGAGEVDDLSKSKIVYYANQTLTALWTRFPHKTNYVNVELQDGLNKYYLRPVFAVSDTDVGNTNPRYIQDSADNPIDPRIAKIVAIMDRDAECFRDIDVLINDHSRNVAVKSLGYDGFFVREPVAGNIFEVEYQCLHPLLTVSDPVETEKIILAPVLEEALTCRIAAKVYGAIGNEDATLKSKSFMNQYEEICLRAEADDALQRSSSNDHDKVREGGWE